MKREGQPKFPKFLKFSFMKREGKFPEFRKFLKFPFMKRDGKLRQLQNHLEPILRRYAVVLVQTHGLAILIFTLV